MPLPPIQSCLVCEDIRLERRKLTTLLGFYGVLPDLEILVKDFSKQIEKLVFFMTTSRGEKGEGRFQAAIEIVDEKGTVVVRTPNREVTIADCSKRTNIALGVVGLRFPHPGKYNFRYLVDDKIHYETTLLAGEGKPEDFI